MMRNSSSMLTKLQMLLYSRNSWNTTRQMTIHGPMIFKYSLRYI